MPLGSTSQKKTGIENSTLYWWQSYAYAGVMDDTTAATALKTAYGLAKTDKISKHCPTQPPHKTEYTAGCPLRILCPATEAESAILSRLSDCEHTAFAIELEPISEYRLYLPTQEQLIKEIDQVKRMTRSQEDA